jgi:hypothetical protein
MLTEPLVLVVVTGVAIVLAVEFAVEVVVVVVKGELIKFLKNFNFIYCGIRCTICSTLYKPVKVCFTHCES